MDDRLAAPPPVLVADGLPPYGLPSVATQISPDSVMTRPTGHGPDDDALLKMMGSSSMADGGGSRGPPMLGRGPPMLGAGGPPPLRRQNASRFCWPLDDRQEWCYIQMPPDEIAHHCQRVLGRPTSVFEVADLFTAPQAALSRAYSAYAERYRVELDAILRLREQTDANRPLD